MSQEKETAIVTGGLGFIGSHLVDRLARNPKIKKVVVIDNLSTGREENCNPSPKVEYQYFDLRENENVQEVFGKSHPDIVFHLAAMPSVRRAMEDPTGTASNNIMSTVSVLEAMNKTGVKKLVFAGSSGVEYGEPEYKEPVREDHPLRPLDPYGASKVSCESYFPTYNKNYGIQTVTLRLPNVYGPRQNPEGGCGIVGIFLERMVTNKDITIFGDGSKARDMVYVEDIVKGFLLAGNFDESAVFNLGSGRAITMQELTDELIKATNYQRPINYGPDKNGEVHTICSDATKANTVLKWVPEVGIEEGLQKTVSWYKQRYAQN